MLTLDFMLSCLQNLPSEVPCRAFARKDVTFHVRRYGQQAEFEAKTTRDNRLNYLFHFVEVRTCPVVRGETL